MIYLCKYSQIPQAKPNPSEVLVPRPNSSISTKDLYVDVFSIHELAQWAERATIVQLAEDGREKDLDDMITERVAVLKESEKNE